MLSPLQAAKQAGVSKATIHRAIKAGKLSANRQEDGSYMIDPAELCRVFETVRPVSMKQSETPIETAETAVAREMALATLNAELAGAKALQAMLERQLEDMKIDRDAWRSQAERLALPAPKAEPASLIARLFGRKVA